MDRSNLLASSSLIDRTAKKLAIVKAAIKSIAAMSARRKGVLLSRLARRMQAVACVADRVQELHGKRPVDLRSQATDMCLDHAGLWVEVDVPNPLEQHGSRHDPAFVAHEDFEQRELPWLQFDRRASAHHCSLDQVQLQ